MTPLIDDETATRYWSERDTAPEAERESRNAALIDWAKAKKADQFRAEQQQAESAYTDLEGWWKENGAGHVFEKDEDRLEVANRRFIANQFQQTPDQQGRYYPTYRDEYLQKTFGKSGLSETDTFNLIRDSLTARKATEDALRELPGALAKGMFSKVAEGKTLDETDSWFLFQDWKDRHADKLGKLPEGWESAMLDRAVKLQVRSETMMRDLAPESKRAFDTLMAFTRPEDAEALPEAGRADVENIAKEFAKLTPEDRQNIYSTLYYAAEADGAGMGKGFFEKVGEGIARGGVNIYNDAEMTAQDRQARQNISYFQSLLDQPEQQPDRMQTDESIQMQRDMAQKGVEENTQRLSELKALREIRQIAQGTIDPIKTEMDGVMGSIVQGAYDFSQSAVYTGLAAVPYVGLPAVMGALTNSNYLRMLDTYPDMDADAALAISGAIAAPQAFIERFQGRALVGKSPMLNSLMKKMTDVRIPIAGRLAIGYGANVAYQTGQEFVQEAMPVAADQIAAAIREDMPEFDAGKAWGAYVDQMPDIFFSMLWAGLIGTGTSSFRELKRNGQYERSLGELEMVGITGEAAQDIAAEQDLDAANTKFQEAWDKRTPEDIQAGIAKRAAQLEAARSTQQNPELPVRRIEENADGTLTHIIEKPDGTVLYRTNDSDAADTAFVNITGMVGRSQLTGTTRGIVESLSFIDQVNQAAGRGEDVQKLLIDDAPRNLLDEYEANPTEQNLNNLFETVRSQGQDINEPAELANFPVLASNQGALVDGVFRSIIKIQDGATGDKVMRDFSQDNLKRAIAENRITMDWVRENLNQVIPLIESERNTGPALRTETDTDVIESFSDVAVAYMTGRIREEQIPAGFRGFLRRMAIIVKDIFRRAYRLKRAIAEGKVDSNFESFLAESVGLNQQTMVDTTRERASGDIITNGGQMLMDFSLGSRTSAVSNDTPSIRASNATITGPANYSIAAHHGTPHKVDKFSTEKIGTGEGAQAYGWGMYFAGNQSVAEDYRNNLSDGRPLLKVDGQWKAPSASDPLSMAAFDAAQKNFDYEQLQKEAEENVAYWTNKTPNKNFSKEDLAESAKQARERLEAIKELRSKTQDAPLDISVGGNLYSVELDVDDADLLDWDKPLSEQSPKVKAALEPMLSKLGSSRYQIETKPASAFYAALSSSERGAFFSVKSPKAASEALLAAGIPGIRYLDGSSRSEGIGTYNYVVFDENLIKITEENGNRIPASQAIAQPVSTDTNFSIGRSDEITGLPLNPNGTVTVYHGTTKESAAEIQRTGILKSAGEPDVYFTTAKEGTGYGDGTVVGVEIDPKKLILDDEFPDGRRDFRVNVGTSKRLAVNLTTGATNYSIGKKQSAGGIRFDEITKEDPKHDGSRVGTAWQGKVKPTTQQTNDGIATIKPNELEKQMAMLTQFVDGVPLPKFITKFKDAKKRMRAFIDFQKGNLLALYDAFDALSSDYVIRSTHWYDGARLLAEGVRDNYRLTIEQSSAIISVFSPMKDWFQNVAMGQRFADVMANHKNKKITKATMGGAMREMLDAAEDDRKIRKAFKQIEGRSISQLLKDKSKEGRTIAAVAVRLMSTNVHGLTHDVLSPEGESLGIRKNLDGTNKKLVWQSYTFIEKAISIYEDGSAKNISKVLGTEHKIRNFYNNIVAPTSPFGDATVDTHAVNAAVLYPMGNKGYLVGLNFGNAGVAGGGNSGIYWLFHEALREAAKERGVMPRQMQSITWEAIRGLFTDIRKRDKNFVAGITKIWETSSNADAARTQIIGLGITPPEWARVGSSNSGGEGGMRSSTGQVADSAGSVQSGIRQGRQGGDRRAGVNFSIASQSEIDRVNKALGGMNRGPDERLKVYERARAKFGQLLESNKEAIDAIKSAKETDTAPALEQVETERASNFADLTAEENAEVAQALQDNADTFMPRIEAAATPAERKRVERDAKDRAKILEQGIRDKYKERKTAIDTKAKSQSQQIKDSAANRDSASRARMTEKVRRTKLLQSIGELDAVLSVLPPEIRGKVGGFAVLANIGTGDKALSDFFVKRIERIDTELEKVLVREYTEAITKAVKKSRPKAGDNGVRKSTLGAETQKFADMVYRATLLDDEATPKRMSEIEAALANPDATAEDISALSEEWSILNTFGDLDNRSSETLAQGLDWLKGQLQMGREAWRIKEQARIDEQRARAAETIEWLGKGTAKKRFADKGLMQRIAEVGNNYLLDHASFEQFVTAMLPPEIAANFSERLRKADMAAQSSEIRDGKGILDAVREGAKAANMSAGDAMLWLKGDQKNAVAYLEGRKVKDERIAIELAQKIVTSEADRSKLTDADIETLRNELAALPADTQKEFVTIKRVIFRGEDVKLDMSRAKAMQLLLSWNQPDVQIKMRKEGWTDESAADLNALVNDPVSREVMAYAKELYGKGAGIVNPVYSRMFGMNMPQVKNYAPTRFLNAKDSKDIGLDGSPTATGTTPGFAKSRVTHSAKIAPEDALTVMQGHIAQQAHWVHFAELAREFRAILSNPEVRESLKQTHGEGVLKSAELWADQLEQRGGNKALEVAWLNPILGTVLSGKAVSSLGFSLKTLAMQLDNTIRFGLALDMRQIVSALSNPAIITEDIQTVWESDAIQNRLQGGATAEARFLFSRYAGKPNFGAKIAEASMTPINWLDSAATSISSAIVYRANLNDALAAGMPENLAKQAALDAASQAIYRFAQPVSFGQKSIMENNKNVLAKTFFLFMSDPRLKTAILADAARGLATGQGNANEHIRRILVVETMAVLSHVVASAFRDVFSDDDDEEIWNLGGFAKAILLAPLQGFFFAGTVGELAISKLTGQKTFNSSTQNPLLSAMEQAVRAGNNLDDVFNLDDPDAMLKEWNNIFRSMALSPAMAAPAVLLNMVKPALGLYQNATTEE